MRVSELLKAIASDLESHENEALLLSEYDDVSLAIVSEALVKAAGIIKEAAENVELVEPKEETVITSEKIDELAALAESFDQSDDELLQKQASVIDEILLTIGSPKDTLENIRIAEDKRIEEIKKNYQEKAEDLHEAMKTKEAEKAIKASEYFKEYRVLEAPLNTRYCPDHPGAMTNRIAEHEYQCSLDKKIYNYETGYKTLSGNVVPGGSVDKQTPLTGTESHGQFDSRDGRLSQMFDR